MLEILDYILIVLAIIFVVYGLYVLWRTNKVLDECDEMLDKIREGDHGES